jgi:zinc transport system substrate-binding protein
LAYFAGRIGGDRLDVAFDLPANVDPAYWQPGPEVISAYQDADLILLNGAGYARWVALAALPGARLVDTSSALRDRLLRLEGGVTHNHGPQGEHSHGETAHTTWLDPSLALEQARAVRDALVAARPALEQEFDGRLEGLATDLLALAQRLEQIDASGTPLLASHPVYQYLAAGYDLELRSVHFEPDELPTDAAWDALIEMLTERPARWMLWEAEPLADTDRRLKDLGVVSVIYDPCATRPASGDWLSVMRGNVGRLEQLIASED